MVSMAKRIEELRTAKGLNRVQLSTALGYPRTLIEKFETGRQTPSKLQLEKLAAFFEVSVDYITGETDDATTMASWLADNGTEFQDAPVRKSKPKNEPKAKPVADGNSVFAALLKSDAFKQAVIDVLKTPEGKELIRKACEK